MTEQEVYKKIEDTYNSEKGKGFITHLLRSFFPVNKSHYVLFREKDVSYKCCMTGEILGTKDDMFDVIMSGEGQKAMLDNLTSISTSIVNEEESYTPPESVVKLKESIKPLAIMCEKSNKYLSQVAFEQLQNFYVSELLKGNKHINWVVNNEKAKEFVKSGKKSGYIKTKKEERAVHKASEHSGMKLGDLEALQEIRKRIEKDES